MVGRTRIRWKEVFTQNISYKLVSLFIALILWVTILGRRDFSLSKNVEIEFQLSSKQALVSQSVDFVKVKVSGPRTALKKFMDSGLSQLVVLDISNKGYGEIEIPVPTDKIDVPFGVKVIAVKPAMIRAQVISKD